nr:SseB family protein [Streptomyces sp. SID14478]
MTGVCRTCVHGEAVVGNDAGAALAERIAAYRGGSGDPRKMVGELRRAALLVPLDGGRLWTGHLGGVRWIYAFTGEEALARFARSRGEGQRDREYAQLLGARLLDEIVPAMGEPAGVAVDVADEDGAMLFPPVLGIVPEAAAVDREPDDRTEEG